MKNFSRRWMPCALLLCGSLLLVQPFSARAEVDYKNPVIPGDHPDPSITRAGKDFWATCTSSEWGPEFPLLHSTDLVNWAHVSDVFPHRPKWATANFWAPEIAQYKSKFFVYYVGREKDGPLAVAVATADKPEGPYTDHGPIVAQPMGSIDPAPCLDEHGQPYLIWKDDSNSIHKPTTIWAQPLTNDGTKLTGEPTALIHNDADWEGPLVEGPFIIRHGDWFYLFYSGSGCCGPDCNYALGVARSHTLLGPWEKNPVNPILAGNDTWKCPGHGTVVEDQRGRYWLLYHSYSAKSTIYTGREAMLDEVKFGADGWPTINDGRGPSVQAPSPFGAVQLHNNLSFHDDFHGSKLRPGWEWPQGREPSYELTGRQLILTGRYTAQGRYLPAVIAHATTTGDYTASTLIDVSRPQPGSAAGLVVFGDAHNAISLSADSDGQIVLWRRGEGKTNVLASVNAPAGKKLHLRVKVNQGDELHFAASADGKKWISIGENLTAKGLPPWDRSLRVALIAEGDGKAEGRFDSFDFVPTNEP
jgi:xylan 1,4-beta-xylosidase